MTRTRREVAATIEHTLLKPEATIEQIDALVDEAIAYEFVGVCVNPIHVARVAKRLESRGAVPRIVTAVGFPLGATRTDSKADEARRALDDGATDIDMVANLGALVAGDQAAVRREIETLARVVHQAPGGRVLKVILETTALTEPQIILGCRCCAEGEADFVKSSTGFHPTGGATVEHVRLLHRFASPIPVKASGGIRTAAAALALLDAGAGRLGTSAGVAILNELAARSP